MSQRDYPCEFCDTREELEERLVTVYRHRRGQHFIFERVPAWVCRMCGHRYFSADVAEKMDRLMDAPETRAQTPVISLTGK
jgi:YgiT-type zinc finger domain-containing protein